MSGAGSGAGDRRCMHHVHPQKARRRRKRRPAEGTRSVRSSSAASTMRATY